MTTVTELGSFAMKNINFWKKNSFFCLHLHFVQFTSSLQKFILKLYENIISEVIN